jgi:hypothetical protein
MIKFWTRSNGSAVRLTLRDGQFLSHENGGPTDEGYESHYETWSLDGDVVTLDYGADGRDCDGRISTHGTAHCPVDRLASGAINDQGIRFPAWIFGESSQRDYSAEAAGY